MILTKKQRQLLRTNKDDNEIAHGLFENFMIERLEELDPQFIKSLLRATKDIAFWYA